MDTQEWESLCDGCGKCCLEKVQDADTEIVYTTAITCRLLDPETCRCSNYAERFRYMDDCIKLTPKKVYQITWLPKTCAYRLVKDGKDLPDWHPLITGNPYSTMGSGNSAREVAIHPFFMDKDKDIIDYILAEEEPDNE